MDTIRNIWDTIYREWLPGAEHELIPDYDIENYLQGDNTANDYVSAMWLPVKEGNWILSERVVRRD